MKKALIHFLLYTVLICGMIYLYYPFNDNSETRPSSQIQFVYQNF